MTPATAVLLVNLVATAAMTGVIWAVQLVIYPAFSLVGAAEFPAYHAEHSRSITLIVGPLMIAELATALWLVFDRPAGVPLVLALAGAALAGSVWLLTAFIFVPIHNELATQPTLDAARRIADLNWLRTAAWSGHLAVVVAMTVLAWQSVAAPAR